jgi:hypothetical protein
MEWAWRFGMIILSGVPAIVGGGLTWHLSQSWTLVCVWEAVLLALVGIMLAKGDKARETAHH